MAHLNIEIGRDAILASGKPEVALAEYPELRAEILLAWLLDQTNDPAVIKLVTQASKMLH